MWDLNDELRAKIDYEGGLEEFFCGYSSPENMKDKKLKELAQKFVDAREALQEYIGDFSEGYEPDSY